MFSAVPRDRRALQQLADVHGGYVRLFKWGGLFYGRGILLALSDLRPRRGPVIFIAGTQGKTTTLRAVRHLIGLPVGVWEDSNTNARGEVPWNLLRMPLAAPALPLEVPDGNGELGLFTDRLRPDAAVILNVGREHIGLLGSFEAAIAEFQRLLAALPADGFAVVNADDPHLIGLPTRARRVTIGWAPAADVRILAAQREDGRLRVDLRIADSTHTVRTQLIGLHYAHVVAAAVATACLTGVAADVAVARMGTLPITPSRLQPFPSVHGATILSDDYKATPETVLAGLAEVGQWFADRRWAVLGELTNLPASDVRNEYLEVARSCAANVDRVVTFGAGWRQFADVWDKVDVDVEHADSVLGAADAAMAHGAGDILYVKGTEDVRPRRITVRLRGLPITCAKPECKKARVLCENCAQRCG